MCENWGKNYLKIVKLLRALFLIYLYWYKNLFIYIQFLQTHKVELITSWLILSRFNPYFLFVLKLYKVAFRVERKLNRIFGSPSVFGYEPLAHECCSEKKFPQFPFCYLLFSRLFKRPVPRGILNAHLAKKKNAEYIFIFF